jgi:glutathione S-transferase
MSPYGDFDTMLRTLVTQLTPGPWLLGERFSAADLLWGTALLLTMGFGLVPDLPEIRAYTERVNARPSVARVKARDAEIAAAQEG